MSIEVDVADDRERWNDLLERAETPTPFHRYEFLETYEEHSGMDFHPLVGYNGQEPVGLFPIFTSSRGPVSFAFSPPPKLKVKYLGPVLSFASEPKRRRRDRQHRRFVRACLEWLEREHRPKFVNMRTAVGYDDTRPFKQNRFDVVPSYTYLVDLRVDPDDLLDRFSADARRNVRREYDAEVHVGEGDRDTIRRIIDQVEERHAEQGLSFPIGSEFPLDLYDRAPDGIVRPYRVLVDGEFAGGVLDLEFGGRAHRWIGGAKSDRDLPVNDLLLWGVCEDAMDRGLRVYDLVGADNPRLSDYKAKFGSELAVHYKLQHRTRAMSIVKDLYDLLHARPLGSKVSPFS